MGQIAWLIYVLLDAAVNWYFITKRKHIYDAATYIQLTIFRGLVAGIIGIGINVDESQFFPWLIFCPTSFWVVFDVALNLMRGKKWHYRGFTAKFDRFGKSVPVLYWTLKLLAIITFIAIIFKNNF